MVTPAAAGCMGSWLPCTMCWCEEQSPFLITDAFTAKARKHASICYPDTYLEGCIRMSVPLRIGARVGDDQGCGRPQALR